MKKGQFLPRVSRTCKCGKQFEVRQKKIDAGRGEYCSKACMYRYRTRPSGLVYVLTKENPTSFKPGLTPWNKGTVGVMKPNKTSIKIGQRLSPQTEFKKGQIPKTWKGDEVGYHALHRWVSRHRGKAILCCECGSTKNVQWANISREYKRDLDDFKQLCGKCHREYDKYHLGIATKKFNLKSKR